MTNRILLIIGLCLAISGAVAADGVDTGQTRCYDLYGTQIACPSQGEALFGQDANYQTTAPAYQDNGDGTVTDLNTGLMWQQAVMPKVTFADAMANADTFNLAEYTDWRMPTITELYSLMDFSGSTGMSAADGIPYIDTAYFEFEYGDEAAGERHIDAQYWSSTVYVSTTMNNMDTTFGVNFADGRIKGYPWGRNNDHLMFVRYVRGEAYGENAFVEHGNGTISDNSTGLMWMQYDSGNFGAGSNGDGSLDWGEALQWCESLDYAGYSDWRLPDAKELQGIVDYTRSPDTTNSAAIDPLFRTTAISNPDGQLDFPYFWTSTSHVERDNRGERAVYVAFGEAWGYMTPPNSTTYELMDVHGAGAQRSDPKAGDPNNYEIGFAPQGDVIVIDNYARCVRGGVYTIVTGGTVEASSGGNGQQGQPPSNNQGGQGQPPQQAIDACNGLNVGATCQMNTPDGQLSGTCQSIQSTTACVPAGGRP